MEDHLVWSEYGAPFDPRSSLPRREYRAHVAILQGKAKKSNEKADDAEKQQKKAERRLT